MPRIKCHYADCVFLDEGYCSAAAVEIDPDQGAAPIHLQKRLLWNGRKRRNWSGMRTKRKKRMIFGKRTKTSSSASLRPDA